MASFEPGDTVQIKSGGPLMTVVKVTANEVTCLWFSEQSGEIKTAPVPVLAVAKVELADDEDDEFEDE
jgi:uncharacterized protein YodC (DUF2158 family)